MFPEQIFQNALLLREIYRGHASCVTIVYPIIEITKYQRHRELSVKLFYSSSTNTLEIQPMDGLYCNKVSFFEYKKKERRWIRDKNFIEALIRDLKRSHLWEFVSNQDFMVVNESNTKVDMKERQKNLKEILEKVV